jgi:DNA ligase (NAD+)
MRLSAFERLNETLLEQGSEPFANPRNATSGALRQLDSSITASRPLECLAYDILAVEGADFRTDSESVEALRDWGLPVPERIETGADGGGDPGYHAAFDRDRDTLDYEIDGVVVKLDSLDDRAELGSTSHHPRWAMAFKFEPRKEVTRIDRIAVQVGRTGCSPRWRSSGRWRWGGSRCRGPPSTTGRSSSGRTCGRGTGCGSSGRGT